MAVREAEGEAAAAVALPRRWSAGLRCLAVVPAKDEARSIADVVNEIRRIHPDVDVLVVDDGSADDTAAVAAGAGARVVRLPFNLGIGGAVQTGFRYALEHGFDLAVRLDGDGQHDPRQVERLVAPVLAGDADIAVGSRFLSDDRTYRPPVSRLLGIRLLARIVSLLVGQRVTDTTSGFQALNRRGIALFAADYPHDYPEVEAVVMVFRHRLRLAEVPVDMRERTGGESSITMLGSAYYMVKVLLALFIGLFRRTTDAPFGEVERR